MFLQDKKKKKARQRAHADLITLFGAIDTEKAIQEIIGAIQGEAPRIAKVISKQSCRVTVWEVRLLGQLIHVEYDKFRKELQKLTPVAETGKAS